MLAISIAFHLQPVITYALAVRSETPGYLRSDLAQQHNLDITTPAKTQEDRGKYPSRFGLL
jgi:hypothetical protein